MNILITGNLSSLATTFAKEFAKQKHRVVLVSPDADKLNPKPKNTILYSIDPARDIFRDAMSAYRFDIVVFISTREEQLNERVDPDTGRQLDALQNTLELSRHGNLRRFFYISSTEIYGNCGNKSEDTEPEPASLNGHILVTGEQYCRYYQHEFGLNVTILRLPYVYGPEEKKGLLYRLVEGCKNHNTVLIPGNPGRPCNFLHENDIADFMNRVIEDEYAPTSPVINLSSSITVTNEQISRILGKYFPDASFQFEEATKVFTSPAIVATAKNVFDWVDLHDLNTEL
ncbi:MAG TPA: NAD(P)-dependent oxidoreductase, partial [Anaerolineales bacterium]|nr:NAD(P)-dependent oxidoreductase [Anaerolineales bacterium]